MRLAISNIAWSIDEEDRIAAILSEAGVAAVDVAPGKYFPDPERATSGEIEAVRRLWRGRGFEIIGLQALLFGARGLNLFNDDEGMMLRRLAAVCRIGAGLGARALTFGSPKNRDRSGVADGEVEPRAVAFFRAVGDAAQAAGVLFCLEPNPAVYGCNFMVTTREAADVVRSVDHPAVKLQLDVGAMALNGEPVEQTIREVADVIGHIHASEPKLATLGDAGAPHAEAARAIAAARPDLAVTIEMAASEAEPHGEAVKRAVALATSTYGARP